MFWVDLENTCFMQKIWMYAAVILAFTACKKNSSNDTSVDTTEAAVVSCPDATTPAQKVVCVAEAFMASLSSAQKASLVLSYSKANAVKWSNLPCGSNCRNGLQLSTLTTEQLALAKAVVKTAMGTVDNEGYSEAMQILAADDVLKSAGGGAGGYSSGIYFIAFLGTPSTTGTWQLQFGGHHLAVNTTYEAGEVVSATPLFEGVEPKSWTSNGTTYAPLAQEHDAMAAMLASLSTTQLASAKISSTFSDVVLGSNKDGQFPATKVGLAVSSLSDTQKGLVLEAMKPWVRDANDVTAASLLSIYQNELNSTYIAFSGNASLSNNADYVRIDGPSAWIEFVCQSGVVMSGVHYHSVWRDRQRDYGANFSF